MLITLPDKGAVFHGGQSMAAMFMRGRRVWPEWLPQDLFADGEEGFWAGGFDPAAGRVYQTSAGDTPTESFEQPAGLVERAAGTADAVQTVSAARPTMARWPRGGRRNLLSNTHTFVGGSWGRGAGAYPINSPDEEGWVTLVANGGSGSYVRWAFGSISAPLAVTVEVFKPIGANRRTQVYLIDAADSEVTWSIVQGPGSFTTGDGGNRILLDELSQSISTKIKAVVSSGTISALFLYCEYNGTPPDGASVSYRHPQVEVGLDLTPYQRVTTPNDVTEEGVEPLWHLYNDGGDSLQTDGPVPAGTYGYAWIDPYGEITFGTRVSDGINPVVVADDPGRYLDIILREGDFSAGEKVAITDYWERRYK